MPFYLIFIFADREIDLVNLDPKNMPKEHHKVGSVGFDWSRRGKNFIPLSPKRLGLPVPECDDLSKFVKKMLNNLYFYNIPSMNLP